MLIKSRIAALHRNFQLRSETSAVKSNGIFGDFFNSQRRENALRLLA